MGLIRKSLAVGTVGLVSGSSKKQRVAASSLRAQEQLVQLERQRQQDEHDYRYATDPQYRAHVDALERARLAEVERRAAARRERRARNKVAAARTAEGIAGLAILLVFAVSVAVVALVVWLPQLGVARLQHRPVAYWARSQLDQVRRSGLRHVAAR